MSRISLRPTLTVTVSPRDDGTLELCAPRVGLWRGVPAAGSYIGKGSVVGQLEVLEQLYDLIAPAEARGFVVDPPTGDARIPVGYGDTLVVLDPSQLPADAQPGAIAAADGDSDAEVVFRASSSGRFYARPGPDQPAFVNVGDTVTTGQTVCLLEVMKTFNRITYGGEGLPESARVVAIRPEDGADLAEGDIILELERV